MRIGLTGGAGFIGSHIIEELLGQNHDVVVFDVVAPTINRVEYVPTNILDLEDCLRNINRIDALYHLAAVSDVNVAIRNIPLTVNLNLQGTSNVAYACTVNGVKRFIYASTEWVYHCHAKQGEMVVVDEQSPIEMGKLGHIYTVTKYGGEILCQTIASSYDMNYTILRFGIPYGPRGREGTVFSNFLKNAMTGSPIEIYGNGEQFRCFIYVNDLAEGCVRALRDEAANQIINLTGNTPVSIKQIAETISAMFENRISVNFKDARPQDFGGVIALNEKAHDILAWQPKTSIHDGIFKMKEYMDRLYLEKIH